jgi:queuosine biosynthesis protein QueD
MTNTYDLRLVPSCGPVAGRPIAGNTSMMSTSLRESPDRLVDNFGRSAVHFTAGGRWRFLKSSPSNQPMSFRMCRTGKCRRLHGHSFRVEIHVQGTPAPTTGWVMDFGDIKNAFQPIHDQLDHRYLNDVEGLSNPTSEHLARWIWRRFNHRSRRCRRSSSVKPAPPAACTAVNERRLCC